MKGIETSFPARRGMLNLTSDQEMATLYIGALFMVPCAGAIAGQWSSKSCGTPTFTSTNTSTNWCRSATRLSSRKELTLPGLSSL